MKPTKEQIEELDRITKPVRDWLLLNTHPHMTLIIDSNQAELLEGITTVRDRSDD